MDLYGISNAALHENELHAQASRSEQLNDENFREGQLKFKVAKQQLGSANQETVEKLVVSNLNDITKAGHVYTGLGQLGKVGEAAMKGGGVPEAIAGFGDVFARTAPEGGKAAAALDGVEGVVNKALSAGGAGAEVAFRGAKVAGNIGALVDAGSIADNLLSGRGAFTGSDGKKQSDTDIWGDVLTIGGGLMDVAAAFTGGALLPAAAAVNLLATGVSGVGSVEDAEKDDKDTAALKPARAAAGSIGPEFASLGFVGSMSHSPVAAIGGSSSF